MNFFRNRSLKQLAIITAVAFIGIILLQLVWLRSRFDRIESVQYQIDFARSLQLNNQVLALKLQQSQQEGNLLPGIISLAKEQDTQLQLLQAGGRIPGSEVFLPELQRLPAITNNYLMEVWAVHKKQILEFNPSDDTKKLTEIQAQSIMVSDWF